MAVTDKAAGAGVEGVAKKTRKPQVRKPIELAVVAKVTDSAGNPIEDAHIEIVHASKDVAGAFRLHKQTPGSDMTTFTLSPGSKEVETQKA